MATCVTVDVNNFLLSDPTPIDSCVSYILMDASTYKAWAPFDPSALSPVTAIEAFGAGFVVMGIPMAAVYAVRGMLGLLHGRNKG